QLSAQSATEQPATTNELPTLEISANANHTATAIGTLVHRTLAQICADGIEHWSSERIDKQIPVWRAQLQQLSVFDDLSSAAATIQRHVSRCCAGKYGKWVLDNTYQDSQCEWPLTVKSATGYKQYRVDRTFIDEYGTRWVVDYKSSQPATQAGTQSKEVQLQQFLNEQKLQYQKQMLAYGEGFRKLENRPVKLALYYPAIDYLQVL
ncbi:MAG: PD-(D/E)XK nuclease family protein, partial [Pseudomonadales bacterium]|nr:PD-(D/E)XK nuclease family protein [Pseudomonadales bacterium]